MKLQTKTALLLVPIIVAALAAQALVSFQKIRETSEQGMLDEMSTLLAQVSVQVHSRLRTTVANTELYAGSPSLIQYMLAENEGERYRIMHLPLMRLFASYQRAYPDYYEIRIVLPDGYEDARSTIGQLANLTEEEADTPYFRELAEHEEDLYTQFIRSPDTGETTLLVSKRLRIRDQSQGKLTEAPKLRGYLLVTESLAFLTQQVDQNRVGQSGHIFLTNGEGEILFHPNPDRIGKKFTDAVRQASYAASAEFAFTKSKLNGETTYIQALRLHPDLVLVGTLPEHQLLAASRQLGKVSSAITLATIVLATLILFGLVRKLLLKPVQRLSEAAQQIGLGNLQVPIDIESRDEIGELAISFRTMAQNLQHTTVSQQYVENVIGSMNDALTVASPDGDIQLVNNAVSRLLGYTRDELLGQHVNVLYPLQMRDSICDDLERLLATGTNFVLDGTFLGKTGTAVPVSVSWSLMRGTEGQPEAIVCVAKDISERIESERQLEAAKNAAEAASRAKSDFLAVMSHEIRTPMNGVLGMTELLLGTGLDAKQRRLADTAMGSAKLLLTIINDILDFSKIEAGQMGMEFIPTDLRAVINDVATAFVNRVEQKGIQLTVQMPTGFDQVVEGDQVRLTQILTNLLGNALKFTEQGEIVVGFEVLSETDKGMVIRFSVSDTGIGIDLEKRDHIFDSFAQADSSTTRTHGGTGLGLAICQRLVGLMNGDIGVDSTPGAGSKFWFTIEFDKSNETLSANLESVAHALTGRRVLIVDDDEATQRMLQKVLQDWEMISAVCDNWSEGLYTLRESSSQGHGYDIAILGHEMADVDGVTLGRLLKAEAGMDSTQLILLSAVADNWSTADTRNAGFAACLGRPVRRTELHKCLCRLLGPTRRPDSLPSTGLANTRNTPAAANILVVEDTDTNLILAIEILTAAGYRVDSAKDGREALDRLEHTTYDIVLMDCGMPVMDGYAATARLREWETERHRPRTTVIALTASAVEGDRERCLAAGMDDYLVKPYQRKELEEKVSNWLPHDNLVR